MLRFIDIVLLSLISTTTPLLVATSNEIGEIQNPNQSPRLVTMNYYKDTNSEMAFNWNTTYPTDSDLQVVKKSEGFESSAILEFQGSVTKSVVQGDGFIHRVVATNLDKGESYLYRVGDKELDNWSEIGEFKTADSSNKASFIHISDPQLIQESDGNAYSSLLNAAISNNNPDFICITGDIVNNSWEDAEPDLNQWEWAISNQNEFLKNTPTMVVAGNHEASPYDFISRYNLPYDDEVNTINGVYYSFDYNEIHFTCLNTNDSSSKDGVIKGLSNEQMSWLKNDLKISKKSKWKIVMVHKGLYDAGGHCSDIDGEDGDIELIRKQLSPLFSEYGVDIVLQGHDHLYSRSYPIEGKIDRNDTLQSLKRESEKIFVFRDEIEYQMYQNAKGPIYVNTGSGSGSKYYNIVDYNDEMIPLEKSYGATNPMFTSYVIEDNKLYANVYEMINGEAVLYDTFGLDKSGNSNTTLTYIIAGIAMLVVISGIVASIIIIKKKGVKKNG